AEAFQKEGSPVFRNADLSEDFLKKLEKYSRILVIQSDPNGSFDRIKQIKGKNPKSCVLLRDLVRADRTKEIRSLEQAGIPTIASSDILGGAAFRYPGDHRKHIAIMISDDHYQADRWFPELAEKWEDSQGYYCTIMHGEGTPNIHSVGELEKADVFILYIRRLALPKDQLDQVRKYMNSGRGFIGMRTACHGFHDKGKIPADHENWPEFDADVLGGNYHNHGKNKFGSDIYNVSDLQNSQILKGVEPVKWHSIGSLYFTDPVKKDATVYQLGSSPEAKDVPITWTRMYGKTRVAFTALGHPEDLKEPAFHKLMINLIEWAAKK
ncbi:MAG: ThuA domain-containing protein, partial [Planctomycetia bacterium]|nr:ThuA domain-containing protein [Planctomycetia bacterium]